MVPHNNVTTFTFTNTLLCRNPLHVSGVKRSSSESTTLAVFGVSYRHVSHYPLKSNMASYKIEPVNACNFLRNEDIWKRTSPLCSSSNSSPKTYITLPLSHLKCSTRIQYGRLQNGGRQGHPT
jgi:hypothetical protein